MAAILDIEHVRKDKTFLGGECAVCEEQLELTLRGERILQLTCGHIAHEACFYEYLREFDSHSCPICNAPLSLDSSRGGSVPNIGMLHVHARADLTDPDILSNAVRQGTNPHNKQNQDYAPSLNTQLPWDDRTVTEGSMRQTISSPAPQDGLARNPSFGRNSDRGGPMSEASHVRSNSNVTAGYSASDFPEPHAGGVVRRHDYDLQSMEASVTNTRGNVANPIPPPIVTVRSEFPTLNRSRQQQSLTCLVTVEVGEPNWQPADANLLSPGAASDFGGLRSPPPPPSYIATMQETPEELERITDELQHRVENWHGLDISRYVELLLVALLTFKIREAQAARPHPRRQRPPRVAGAGLLPLLRHAHLRQGAEGHIQFR
jgi:hypothetical protein